MQNNTVETAPKRERTAIYTLARIIFGFLFHTIFPPVSYTHLTLPTTHTV